MSVRLVIACLCVVAVSSLSIRPVEPGMFPGVGVCNGGACSQCSATVYNIENTVMVELVKFYTKLQSISSTLMVDLYSVNRTIQNIKIVNSNSVNVQISSIKIMQTAIVTLINDITVVLGRAGGGHFGGIEQTLIKIEKTQRVLIQITKSMTSITQTIIQLQGKQNVIVNHINDISISIVQLERTVILISQTIISFVSKMESITSIRSTTYLARQIRMSIINIRTSSQKFVSIQQSFLSSIDIIVNLQKVHIQKISIMINKVVLSSTKISESLKFIDSYIDNYKIALTQITANVKSIKIVMSETKIKISRHEAFVSKILSVLAHIKVVIERNHMSINKVHIDLQSLLSQERMFLQEINVLLAIISEQDRKVTVVMKETQAILLAINSKVEIVTRNERKNAASITTVVSAILNDINGMKTVVSTNSQTASTLRMDVGIIEERLDDIVRYLAQFAKKCKNVPDAPIPPCEGPRYTCATMASVCGSDGVTYTSICQMRKIACLERRTITVSNDGPCVTITTTPAPVDCAFTCPPEIKPVCASNGKTYSCECAMRLNACYLGITLTSTPGACKGSGPSPGACSYNCYMSVTNWVCGTDGKDYRNECTMKEASCRLGSTIDTASYGKCSPIFVLCPYPFVLVGDQCIYVTPQSIYGSYAVAKKDCEDRGANLASFLWDGEWKGVQQHIIGIENRQIPLVLHGAEHKSMYWTGAKYDDTRNHWVWDHNKEQVSLGLAWEGNYMNPGYNRCAAMSREHLHRMSARPCYTSFGEEIGWVCKK